MVDWKNNPITEPSPDFPDSDGEPVYDEDTETIKYDAIGNPTKYLGASLKWNGRELTGYTKGSTDIKYTYDVDGLRATKDNNGEKSTYYYVGGQLRYETRGNLKFYYFYDASGNLSAIRYYPNGGTKYYMYYTLTNQFGDIIALYDANANLVASYEYDAWGKVLSVKNANGTDITSPTHIANLNPIRYRGYYYDTETKLYYLQSRYYDPQVGRFLNADGYVTTGQGVLGHNMFAYCENNTVMGYDPCGTCLHQWKFWNDCEKCGGRTFSQKVADYINRINAINQQTAQLENEIIAQQNSAIQESAEALWDAYKLSNQLESTQQQQQSRMVSDFVVDRFSTPEKAANTFNACSWVLGAAAAIYKHPVLIGLCISFEGLGMVCSFLAEELDSWEK